MEVKALPGAYAAAEAMRQINPDVVPVYPITPQSPIAEKFAQFVADGEVDTELINVESEHSAMSAAVGASAAGARAMTATASQGLVLMQEIVNIASGLRLPIVMNVVNRSLSAPINIHCDHSDSMGCRDAGWIQIYSENCQEVYENTLLAVRLAEHKEVQLPVMVMQDGFITSHMVERVNLLDDSKVKKFVGKHFLDRALLNVDKPITVGPLQLWDSFMETKMQQAEAMEKAKRVYLQVGNELSKITKNKYPYFEKYRLDGAKAVIVTMSSTAGTTKEVVDRLRKKGKKVGLLKIKLFRPFPYKEVSAALKNADAIAVLDRSESFGANPPLFGEIKNAVFDNKKKPKVSSYVFGLGGRSIYEKDIEEVFNNALKGKQAKRVIG